MITLNEIGEGAFHGLKALQHFVCQHNEHLSSIHKNAFGKFGDETPPIRSVCKTIFHIKV